MSDTFKKSVEISDKIREDLNINPQKYRVLTGDRPTGNLHLGHYFGSIVGRIEMQQKGLNVMILIADYQVLTDHDSSDKISQYTKELVKDYISAGINFDNENTCVFPHSHIPELNQLLVPFLTLISLAELERNPTVKEEIQSSKMTSINAGMLVYPVHQSADILSVRANLVPVGKDQLPHLEISRVIAKRFNNKFCKDNPVFLEPNALLSNTAELMGLDGKQKMSKSRGNSIMLKSTREEIIEAVKKATTDSNKHIEYDPENRPEISNLINICYLTSNRQKTREQIAEEIGDGGAVKLKDYLIESVDSFLKPMRERRQAITDEYVIKVLKNGIERVRAEATKTLSMVRKVMNMGI